MKIPTLLNYPLSDPFDQATQTCINQMVDALDEGSTSTCSTIARNALLAMRSTRQPRSCTYGHGVSADWGDTLLLREGSHRLRQAAVDLRKARGCSNAQMLMVAIFAELVIDLKNLCTDAIALAA